MTDLIVTIEGSHPDPYGDTVMHLRSILRFTLEQNSGGMNDTEHANLVAIEEFIRERDNA